MKIGYVLKYFPKLSETFVLHEMVALERVGAELEVFAFAPSGGAPLASALGGLAAPVHYLDHMPEGELLSAVSEQWAHIGHPHSIPDLLAQIRSERGSLKLLRRTAELVIHIRTRDIQHL
ncbi:MAG: hypothetical protein OEO23_14445, partial [Gemmatimonadota bacterium]|nr:hypothetical protein [Gemmatimonadota bacterium]